MQKAKTALYEKGIPFESKMIDGSEPVASGGRADTPTQSDCHDAIRYSALHVTIASGRVRLATDGGAKIAR